MQGLNKLVMNCLNGVRIRGDNNEFYKCKSEHWMKREKN